MTHREEQRPDAAETAPQAADLPWMAGGDGGFGYDEPPPAETPLLQLRVTPEVHILVNSSYQLAVAVKGTTPVVINPSVLFDSVNFAARFIAGHQPGPGSEPPKD